MIYDTKMPLRRWQKTGMGAVVTHNEISRRKYEDTGSFSRYLVQCRALEEGDFGRRSGSRYPTKRRPTSFDDNDDGDDYDYGNRDGGRAPFGREEYNRK